jgi:hypothetical protein
LEFANFLFIYQELCQEDLYCFLPLVRTPLIKILPTNKLKQIENSLFFPVKPTNNRFQEIYDRIRIYKGRLNV